MDNSTRFPGSKLEPPRGFGQTPVSNTGVNLTKGKEKEKIIEIGIDWMAGTVHQEKVHSLMSELASFLGDEFTEGKGGIGFYQASYRSVLGVVVGIRPHEGRTTRSDAYFSIPGRVLSALPQQRVHELMQILTNGYDFHYSRLDLKLDDYTKTITPKLSYDALLSGWVSGFRSHHWHSSGSKQRGIGQTLELGRRGKSGGGKFIRIYDKTVESSGEVDATRLELELSGDKCKEVAALLSACPFELFQECILTVISSSVDFIERDSSGRLDRAKRLPWWDFIVSSVDKIGLSKPRVISTMQSVKKWIGKQVAPMFAMVLNSFQTEAELWEFFWEMVHEGESRFNERHLAMLAVSRMQAVTQT